MPSPSPSRVHFPPDNNDHRRSPPPSPPRDYSSHSPDASFDSSDHSSLASIRSSLEDSALLSRSYSGSFDGSSDGSISSGKRRLSPHARDSAGREPDTPPRGGRRGLMDMLRSSVRGVSGPARRRTSGAHEGPGWQRRDGTEEPPDLDIEEGKEWAEKLYDPRPSRVRSTRLRPRQGSLDRSNRSALDMEEGRPSPARSRSGSRAEGVSAFQPQGGIFSHLLQLSALPPPPGPYTAAFTAGPSASRQSEDYRPLPTLKSLGIQGSSSIFHKDYDDVELDSEDPRVTGVVPRRNAIGGTDGPFLKMFADGPAGDEARRQAIQRQVTDILTRQTFILKLAKALMAYGAPSHRIESQLYATALILSIEAQFIHFPSLVIASFGDADTRTSETHFIKSGSDLDLGKLHQVHGVYRAIVHDEMDADEGVRRLDAVLGSERAMSRWLRMILAFLSCGLIAPMFFGGSVLDALAAGTLGMGLDLLQGVAGNSALYSNVFEITIATLISFIARGLSVTGYFCYGAVASAGVCLILPGYAILCGSLELASRNLISGSVRMLYAIIYSLFLGFGVTIGSDLFYVVDPPALRAASAILSYGTETISGSFSSLPSSALPDAPAIWNGTFTFVNSTSAELLSAAALTSLACPREPDWPWWRQAMPLMYLVGLVPLYSFFTGLWLHQPLRSKELPVMVFISSAGFLASNLSARWIWNRDDVVSAIGAFVIGLLGNIYSRVFKGTAFTSMVPGIMFLVPSGISAAGGLAANARDRHQSDAFSEGLLIGARMIQVAIGITVGLFASGMLIYSFGRKKRAALFSF